MTTGRPPLLARLGAWRLTRHPVVRRWYDRLDARGWFVAQLDRFERPAGPLQSPSPPQGVRLDVGSAAAELPPALRDAPVAPTDRVVVARRDGRAVGHCCCSDREVYVPELHRRLRPPGTYVWRVYVDTEERGRGLGTALVARAVDSARTDAEPEVASALVAPDNPPSRRLFRGLSFRPTVRYTSAGLPGHRWHRETRLGSDT